MRRGAYERRSSNGSRRLGRRADLLSFVTRGTILARPNCPGALVASTGPASCRWTMLGRTIAVIVVVCVAAIAAFFVLARRSAIEPVTPPQASSFDPALVRRGGELVAAGNCNTCHTAPGAKSFAGGVGVPTPFGAVYSTNITPDAETGIGRWSQAAFRRSLREGVDRAGRPSLSGVSVRSFHAAHRRRHRCALRLSDVARAGCGRLRPAMICVFPSISACCWRHGSSSICARDRISATPRGARHGIAAPIWSRGLHIAAPATRRATHSARKGKRPLCRRRSEGWTAYALNRPSPAPVPWNANALYSISATAGRRRMAPRAAPWLR